MTKISSFRAKGFKLSFKEDMHENHPQHDFLENSSPKRKIWFRISRKFSPAVKRNQLKRLIRGFVRAQAESFPEVSIIQIYKEHLLHYSDWKAYIDGVQYELAQFAQRQYRQRQYRTCPRRKIGVEHAAMDHALSA